MATSNIIKQISNSTISTDIILKNLIVSLTDLNDERLIILARKELRGYNSNNTNILSSYRKLTGRVVGSFIFGNICNAI